ncbi:DUF669 domain-containing protein [Endozoicomonas euniceicola]|uniref:DUF669 domain-containing protein n=1 Tax=Endozoicomonas euniceicola TaxID=1234143 RepID=A0ABY6GV06_9GAMM|nr:DUF669 domain-containing protein [Endozoicomonas euniceicola]UYM16224.1 DUF669 domain-containing protein [Endozoicomonas euniceicola]
MAQLGFNAGDYDHTDDISPLPAGDYVVVVTDARLIPTKSGGRMVTVTYKVMEGQSQGRSLWSNHNIYNQSDKAQEIGRKEISRIAHAIGQPQLSDTDQLLNQVMTISVIIKQDPGYGPKNEVKKWVAHNNRQQSPVTHEQPPHPATAAAQPSTPPWGQK